MCVVGGCSAGELTVPAAPEGGGMNWTSQAVQEGIFREACMGGRKGRWWAELGMGLGCTQILMGMGRWGKKTGRRGLCG